ncbi:MAG: class I SAM-dependent methyltransferase [Deltaproteobacteria bacterium]|nr:class I SAM-dependent methyltransferase [Deltaproteobacteria bacterium]
MKRDLSAEENVRNFYEGKGWDADTAGNSSDAQLWEDLRPCARDYVAACRSKLLEFLPASGELFLDAASGPIQYPEYLEYSRGFKKRVCVDLSQKALDQARAKLGEKGEYVRASILELPFPDAHFDAVVSLHTIYHIAREQQEAAVRQLVRVSKPGHRVVIVYSNPDRLLAVVKRKITGRSGSADEPLYFHAHPLSWWQRFSDDCEVELHPWRALTAQDSKRLIPDNFIGRFAFRSLLGLEKRFPEMLTRLGAYPIVVLKRKSA